jgi:hypothetical protein
MFASDASIDRLDKYLDAGDVELMRLWNVLETFILNTQFAKTSIEAQVVPAVKNFQSWLRLFPASMHTNRLKSATKARICFAERGIFYLIELFDAVKSQIRMLKKHKPEHDRDTRIKAFINVLEKFMLDVLGCKDTLMLTWLEELVKHTPTNLLSPNTPLTTDNVASLENFCYERHYKK